MILFSLPWPFGLLVLQLVQEEEQVLWTILVFCYGREGERQVVLVRPLYYLHR